MSYAQRSITRLDMVAFSSTATDVSSPEALRAHIKKHHMATQHQVAADGRWIDIHTVARATILAIESAPNLVDLVKCLRDLTQVKTATIAVLVLNALIQYRSVDKSARSRDVAIQKHLSEKAVEPAGVPAYMESRGGLSGVYGEYRSGRRSELRLNRSRHTLKNVVREHCSNGGALLAVLMLDDKGKMVLGQHRHVPSTANAESALAKAAEFF